MSVLLPLILAKALVEVALLLLLARGLLHFLLAGNPARRADNAIYRLCELGTRPLVGGLRALMPRAFPARLLPLCALFLLALLWGALVIGKWQACRDLRGEPACAALAHAR